MSFTKHLLIALAAIAVLSTGAVASAQTTTGTADVTTQATPGTPDTGAGGDATTNWLLLGVTGLAAIAGVGYLARKPQQNVK